MPVRKRPNHRRNTRLTLIMPEKYLLEMRRRFAGTNALEELHDGDQLTGRWRFGETEVTDLTPTEPDDALGTGAVVPVAHHLPCGEIDVDPLVLEPTDVVHPLDSTDLDVHPEDQRVHPVLRCGGAHTSLPSLGATLYAGLSTRESQRIHKVLLAEECFLEALLSIVATKKENPPLLKRASLFILLFIGFRT